MQIINALVVSVIWNFWPHLQILRGSAAPAFPSCSWLRR